MTRLTELRVKVCSMYGAAAVRLARPQRCSTRLLLLCVNRSIRWSSAVRVRVGVCSAERQSSTGEERARKESRKSWQLLGVQKLPLSSAAAGSSLSLSPSPSLSFPLSLSLCCKFLLFPSVCLHAFSWFLLRPQDRSITRRRANKSC